MTSDNVEPSISTPLNKTFTTYNLLMEFNKNDRKKTLDLDKMEKRKGVWKIKFRKIVMTWHQDFPTSEDFERNSSLLPISRATNNREDTSYDFLKN